MIDIFPFSEIPSLDSFLSQEDSKVVIYDSSKSTEKRLPFEYHSYLNSIVEKSLPSYLFLISFKRESITLDILKNLLKSVVNIIEPEADFKELPFNNTILCHSGNTFIGIIKIKDCNNFYKVVMYVALERVVDEETPENKEAESISNVQPSFLEKIKEMFKC